jgi:predicted O-methyltransferase YrrM
MIDRLKYLGSLPVEHRGDWLRYVADRARIRVILHRVTRAIGHDVSAVPSYTTPDELVALYGLASALNEGATVLEIGSHLGKSACFIGAALQPKRGRLYCVDTWQNETMPEGRSDTFEEFRRNTAGLGAVIVPIRKRSDQLAPGDIPAPVHLAFIDGDHSFEAVHSDFGRVGPLIPTGGIVAFHDAGGSDYPGVARVVGEALATGLWDIGDRTGSLFWIRRRGPAGK